jgi:predicted ABC-type ATPase
MMEKCSKSSNVYVIAGPNGAGKTTFASEFLPDFVTCREFLNADLIAAGLSPFAPEKQNILAGRLLLERIADLSSSRADFGFETTLSGRTYFKLLNDLKEKGYRVTLLYLWLPSADLALERVENRVRQGGHRVPADDVKRRYSAGITNFFQLYRPILDSWHLYDASRLPPHLIAQEEQHRLSIHEFQLYDRIQHQAEVSDEKSK